MHATAEYNSSQSTHLATDWVQDGPLDLKFGDRLALSNQRLQRHLSDKCNTQNNDISDVIQSCLALQRSTCTNPTCMSAVVFHTYASGPQN
eukprot:1208418-Amphidinium_carterae.1